MSPKALSGGDLRAALRAGAERSHQAVLRAEGVTADTWDRERAGLSIRREAL
ncbi:MAG: hypothetical protein ACXWKA_18640 [Xanthobacteraceae bacterium]